MRRPRPPRCLALAAVLGALVTLLLLPAGAGADGDPASDVLLGADTFLPYAGVSTSEARALDAATATLNRHHVRIRVAVIAAPIDLGAIPQLFGRPEAYARFLAVELGYYGPHRPLLVVMPDGYGTVHLPARAAAAVSATSRPASAAPGALIRAALAVESRIARLQGIALARSPAAMAGAAGWWHGRLPWIVLLGTISVLGAAGLLLTGGRGPRRRERATDGDPAD